MRVLKEFQRFENGKLYWQLLKILYRLKQAER